MVKSDYYKIKSIYIMRMKHPDEQKNHMDNKCNFQNENYEHMMNALRHHELNSAFNVHDEIVVVKTAGGYLEPKSNTLITSIDEYQSGYGVFYTNCIKENGVMKPLTEEDVVIPISKIEASKCYRSFIETKTEYTLKKLKMFEEEAMIAKEYYDNLQMKK